MFSQLYLMCRMMYTTYISSFYLSHFISTISLTTRNGKCFNNTLNIKNHQHFFQLEQDDLFKRPFQLPEIAKS